MPRPAIIAVATSGRTSAKTRTGVPSSWPRSALTNARSPALLAHYTGALAFGTTASVDVTATIAASGAA